MNVGISMEAAKVKKLLLDASPPTFGVSTLEAERAINWAAIPLAVMQTAAEWPAIEAEGGRIIGLWTPVFSGGKFNFKALLPAVQETAAEWLALSGEGTKLAKIWSPVFSPTSK